jgi:hypothetical protein
MCGARPRRPWHEQEVESARKRRFSYLLVWPREEKVAGLEGETSLSRQILFYRCSSSKTYNLAKSQKVGIIAESYMYGTHGAYLMNTTAQAQCDTHAIRMRGRYKSSSAKGRRRAMEIGVRKRNAIGRRTLQPGWSKMRMGSALRS